MELVKTFEGVNNFVNNMAAGETSAITTTAEVVGVLAAQTDFFSLDERRAERLAKLESNYIDYSAFEDCVNVVALATIQIHKDTHVNMYVDFAFKAIEVNGDFFTAYKTNTKRFGLSLVGFAKFGGNRNPEGQPNFFTTPTAKVIVKWVEWLKGVDAHNREELAKAAEIQAATRAEVAASGCEYSEIVNGIRVKCGYMLIDIVNTESGVYYDYRLNTSVIERTAEGLTSFLAQYGKQQPEGENPKLKAYDIFKALEVIVIDHAEVWSDAAKVIITKAKQDASEVVTDICNRALKGLTRLSNKQKWCIAYAYMRVS